MNLNDIKRRKEEIISSHENIPAELKKIKYETQRVINITQNAETILDNIDAEFERITALNETDTVFLFFAVMLQTARWVLSKKLELPGFEEGTPAIDKSERLNSNEKCHVGGIYDGKSSGAIYETDELKERRGQHAEKAKVSQEEFYKRKNVHRSWIEILTQPVPYDAMYSDGQGKIPSIAGMNRQNKDGTYNNICGTNHHVATLGHDPVLGWIFGTANIMSSTISFINFQNYEVVRGHRSKNFGFMVNNELSFSDQAINYDRPINMYSMFEECYLSIREDYKRFPAAVARHSIHLASDKYCKEGLPIPLLSVFDPQKAQELIEKGWNSVEFSRMLKGDLKQISVNAFLSIFINAVIEAIYLFCLETEDDLEIRQVKIKKILSVANVISSSSNIVYVIATEDCAKLDIGGIGSTLLTYFTSTRYIGRIKREYIEKQFDRLVQGETDLPSKEGKIHGLFKMD